MSSLVFQRPANGAVRDVKELEYISALHQANGLRSDGTVSSDCIRATLLSRHSVSIPVEHIESSIISDLAGDPRGSYLTEKFLDIPQLTALLILPNLARVASSPKDGANHELEKEKIFGHVLRIILDDIGHTGQKDDDLATDEIFLTKEVLRKIFSVYGEDKVCEILLERMMEHVGGDDFDPNSDGVVLNKESFMRALTSDLGAYNSEWETTRSTHFSDFLTLVDGGIDEMERVSKERKSIKNKTPDLMSAQDEETPKTELSKPRLEHITFVDAKSTIDFTIDNIKSQIFFVLLFLSLILSYLAYFSAGGIINEKVDCDGKFGCEVGKSIANWLTIALTLGVIGGIYMMLASAGNGAQRDCGILASILGMSAVYFGTIHPFYSTLPIIATRTDSEGLRWAPYLCVIVGGFLLLQQFASLLQHFLNDRVDFGFLSRKSIISVKELHTKEAAAYKADGLLNHALQHHDCPSLSSSKDGPTSESTGFKTARNVALLNYEEKLNDMETVGGFWWTWKKYLGQELCSNEGVWLGARLIACQYAQIIALFGFFFFLATGLSYIHSEFGETQASSYTATLQLELEGGVRSMYFNASGSFIYSASEVDDSFLSSNNLVFGYNFEQDMGLYKETAKERVVRRVIGALTAGREASALLSFDATEDIIDKMASAIESTTGIPLERTIEYVNVYAAYEGGMSSFVYEETKKLVKEEELKSALIFGWVCAIIALLSIILSFIPRYVSQALIFRSGVGISPLIDPMFANFKQYPWTACTLFGESFWGFLIAGMLVWFLFAGTLFLFIWSETSSYALRFIALWIGIFVSWIVKTGILSLAQKRTYSGLYRVNPARGNIITVVMETWNVGITLGFVSARAVKMILMTFVYIGRLDTYFVAPHVTFFGLGIDEDYQAFNVDLLLHECHRHPYLERLSLLYLIKVHEGDTFAKRQGSCWRLLFVLALMPWLRRYRSKEMQRAGGDFEREENKRALDQKENALSDVFEENERDKSD